MGRVKSVLLMVICLAMVVFSVNAHKTPLVEFTKLGIWETTFTYAPRQPLILEDITLIVSADHPGVGIKGETKAKISVYLDRSVNEWRGGKTYYRPNWMLLQSEWGEPNDFFCFKVKDCYKSNVVTEIPGNYVITVDWYEDGQFRGQDTHPLDVEQRTMGPLYWVFSFLIVGAVLVAARFGIV